MDCWSTNWNFQPSPPYWTMKHNLDFKHLLVVLLSIRLGKQGRKKHTNCKAARKAWDSKFRSADSGRSSLHLSALCTLHRHSIHSVHYQQHKKQMLPHLLHILMISCYKSVIMYCTERDLFSWSTPIRCDGGGAPCKFQTLGAWPDEWYTWQARSRPFLPKCKPKWRTPLLRGKPDIESFVVSPVVLLHSSVNKL
jgi:hypothetical protein